MEIQPLEYNVKPAHKAFPSELGRAGPDCGPLMTGGLGAGGDPKAPQGKHTRCSWVGGARPLGPTCSVPPGLINPLSSESHSMRFQQGAIRHQIQQKSVLN